MACLHPRAAEGSFLKAEALKTKAERAKTLLRARLTAITRLRKVEKATMNSNTAASAGALGGYPPDNWTVSTCGTCSGKINEVPVREDDGQSGGTHGSQSDDKGTAEEKRHRQQLEQESTEEVEIASATTLLEETLVRVSNTKCGTSRNSPLQHGRILYNIPSYATPSILVLVISALFLSCQNNSTEPCVLQAIFFRRY